LQITQIGDGHIGGPGHEFQLTVKQAVDLDFQVFKLGFFTGNQELDRPPSTQIIGIKVDAKNSAGQIGQIQIPVSALCARFGDIPDFSSQIEDAVRLHRIDLTSDEVAGEIGPPHGRVVRQGVGHGIKGHGLLPDGVVCDRQKTGPVTVSQIFDQRAE